MENQTNLTVYLAGPIMGLTYKEASDWRIQLSNIFNVLGIQVINPLDKHEVPSEVLLNDEKLKPFYDEIIAHPDAILERDLLYIRKSDVLIANFTQKEDSVGTLVEIGYALALNKHMIIITKKGSELETHPFTGVRCTIVHSIEDAEILVTRIAKSLR